MRFGVALLGLLALPLAAQKIGHNFDQDTDFSKFKSYKWVEIKTPQQVDQITAGQISAALDKAMAAKGLQKTDSDSADLYVGYQVGLQNEQQLTTFNNGGWGYGPRWGGGMGGMATTTTSTITTGVLTVDMYEAAAKKLVWRGTASDTVDGKNSPEKRVKKLDKAAEKLMKNYPPKKKS
jgi:hypothetical protein